jgi:hypothetical protein
MRERGEVQVGERISIGGREDKYRRVSWDHGQ